MKKWGMRKRKNRVFPGRRISPGILFSALIIAISFVAMIVPLALFHSAQIAATSRLRIAVSLLATVVIFVLFLGILGKQPSLVFGGIVGLFWIPIFAIVLYQRMTLRSMIFSALLLCLPVFILIFFAFVVPINFDLAAYLQSLATPPPGAPAPSAQALGEWNALVQSLQATDGALAEITLFSKMNFWKRMSWFAYGGGSSWLLSSLGVGIANLIFLDFAFEQVEKLKAVAVYVQENANRFSRPLIESLAMLMQNPDPRRHHKMKRKLQAPPAWVVRETHTSLDEDPPFWSLLVRPARKNSVLIWGHTFEFQFSPRIWHLRSFSLPFGIVAGALVFLGYFAVSMGGSLEIIDATQGRWAPLISIGGVGAFVILAVVAAQGTLVLLERLTSGFLLVVGIVLLMILSVFPVNAHLLLGIFGVLGIFDYAYDLRGHLANNQKPV